MKRAPLVTIGFVPSSLVVSIMKSSFDHICECWRAKAWARGKAAEYIHVVSALMLSGRGGGGRVACRLGEKCSFLVKKSV